MALEIRISSGLARIQFAPGLLGPPLNIAIAKEKTDKLRKGRRMSWMAAAVKATMIAKNAARDFRLR